MIIGITGFAGSGKNTAASMINFIVNGYTFEDWQGSNVIARGWPLSLLQQYRDKNYSYYGNPGLSDMLIDIAGKNERQVEKTLKMFFEEKSFADKMKQICSILTGIPREDWDKRELRNQELPIKGLKLPVTLNYSEHDDRHYHLPQANYTYRMFMQRVGTEAMRDNIHENVWINALMVDYLPLNPDMRSSMGNVLDYSDCTWPNWIITDVRFLNEAQAIKKKIGSIILKLTRGDRTDDLRTMHASEAGVMSIKEDYFIINDYSLEQLYECMTKFLTHFNLIQNNG